MLIKIEAIVREEKMEDVKAALNDIQVNGFTVTQIMGCGTQRGYTEYVRGSIPAMERYSAMRYATLFVSVQARQDTMRCSRNSCKIIKM